MSENGWLPGQRVRNEGEPGLGLGIVSQQSNTRTVAVYFPAVQENRVYSLASAPLRRFHLAPGQVAMLAKGGSFRVEKLFLKNGLLHYSGGGKTICETDLADRCTSSGPSERLSEGELSHVKTFDLRVQGWQQRGEILSKRYRGLTGARVALMPHQLAIACKVAARELPRVLLADEVGLGKTIEACMIYSMLRAVGRADRVLVLTPASLVHQWLTELYRRFNELFKVAHSELEPLVDETPMLGGGDVEMENPFEDASRIIAPIEMLRDKRVLQMALETPWDLLIVDEAHHLRWSRTQVSQEYRCVQALAQRSRGLLLLTATPLRQGLETQFALMHLVDPDRFARLDDFLEENKHLMQVGHAARALAQGSKTAARELRKLFPDDHDLHECLDEPDKALPLLVDRHGTGRVLVRNRRERLTGFPGRQLLAFPLPCPASWKNAELYPEVAQLERLLHKAPVTVGGGERSKPVIKDDPRWNWTVEWIRSLPAGTKVVVMASKVKAVLRLEKFFREKTGLKVAVFHEELSLIERDRQAAYFAEDDGAQVLLCSEIGGEGRNFQFCSHLLLFDLPVHPDALEQRIGRLDRIGQKGTIQVAVPYVENTPSQALFEWHRLTGVFERPLPSGDPLMDCLQESLFALLQAFTPRNKGRMAELEAFLEHTKEVLAEHLKNVQTNVDFLVDINSYDQTLGEALKAEILAAPTDPLKVCISEMLEHFGVNEEELATPGLLKIRAGDLMKVDPYPGLRDGGYLATFDRSMALAREEVQFLSMDHPLVEGTLGLLLDQAEGKACTGLWEGAPEQNLLVQFLYLLQAVGPARLDLHRYLAPTPLVVSVDMKGKVRDDLQPGKLSSLGNALWTRLAGPMLGRLPQMQETGGAEAQSRLGGLIEAAVARASEELQAEQQRLEYLAQHNNVSPAEVAAHEAKAAETLECLSQARVELDAIRVIVLDPRKDA
ncbi:MAG: RNA polymerase-associated protein RapA [Vulcanimicrobiota bacterium]